LQNDNGETIRLLYKLIKDRFEEDCKRN